MRFPPIALLTDFGSSDAYVAAMKGVILTHHPRAAIVDIGHDIFPQNITQAGMVLEGAYRFFPKKTVFVAVVDPGVGTDRRILVMKTREYLFLAPDNGLLGWVSLREPEASFYSIENPRFFLTGRISSTFHGRDIFAPAAARLARDPSAVTKMGPRVHDINVLDHRLPKTTPKGIQGRVAYLDHFGNAITNIREEDLVPRQRTGMTIRIRQKKIPLRKTYGQGPEALCALWNSAGRLEIAWPRGSAAKRNSLCPGETVWIRLSQ